MFNLIPTAKLVTMPSRNRTKDGVITPQGVMKLITNFGTTTTTSGPTLSERWNCFDYTQPHPYKNDQPLVLSHFQCWPLILNGSTPYNGSGSWIRTFESFPQRALWSSAEPASGFNWSYWITKALANMDPYKPQVDLPLFAIELLREGPTMLRDLGRHLMPRQGSGSPRNIADANLAWQFGWAPLVNDVGRMFDLAHATNDRMRYLRNLEDGNRVHRSLQSNKEIRNEKTSNAVNIGSRAAGMNPQWCFTADVRVREFVDVWYSANGKLLNTIPDNLFTTRSLSNRQMLGLRLHPTTMWNAIPWSWLTDYFSNFGDVLEASETLASLKVTRMCVMQKNTTFSLLENARVSPGVTHNAESAIMKLTQKARTVSANPTPRLAATPWLNARQAGILGSLAVVAAFRGRTSQW